MTERWEVEFYSQRVESPTVDLDNIKLKLNELGEQGWQLVQIDMPCLEHPKSSLIVVKRRLV